ncbi:MAG: hypothetical protein ACWA6U_03790 [Breznakibacter sp.]
MKKELIFIVGFIVCLMVCNSVYSQYNSSFEEKVFVQFKNRKGDAYDLLNAINYDENLYLKGKKLIDEHVNDLKSKGIQSKSLNKQIQLIYKTTNSKFLKKYEPKAFFNNIFETGQYNCVSASALYSLIFDEFKINYSIKETPVHIYIIADTLGLQTLIETTLPGTGLTNFNDKFKKDYIEYLRFNKLISDQEYTNSTSDELFREYYSKDKTINLIELSAIQYYNKGVFLMEEEKFSGATLYLQKALAIHPSNNVRYCHYAALQNALANDVNKKLYDGKLFGQIINSSINDSSLIQLVSAYFDNVSHELCINSSKVVRYDQFFNNMISQCSLKDVPSSILYKYHYSKAFNYGMNGMYPTALLEVKNAIKYNKNNLLVKDLAQNIAVKHMFVESNYKKQIDSLEYYFEELPFLIDNKIFQHQYVYYYMKVVSECFMYNESIDGLNYYDRFLGALHRYGITNYSEDHIGAGFGVMVFHYIENNDFKKALQILNEGLALSPNSLKLIQIKAEIDKMKQPSFNKKNSDYNYVNEVIYIPNKEITDELNDKINKYFSGKWKAVSIIIEDMEQELNGKETFEIVANKNKDCSYIQNNITEKGKWAYRPQVKCIYFVPDSDKDKYKVFKVKEMSAGRLILLPYKDQKKPSPYWYVLKPYN